MLKLLVPHRNVLLFSSNVNKTKLAEYAKQACLYATGYYSRRLPHTNFATNSRGISVESRVIAQFLDTTTYTKTKEEVSNTILRRARPGHIRLHKPLRCAKLLSSRRQERVPTSHGHCWGQVRYLKYFKNIFLILWIFLLFIGIVKDRYWASLRV